MSYEIISYDNQLMPLKEWLLNPYTTLIFSCIIGIPMHNIEVHPVGVPKYINLNMTEITTMTRDLDLVNDISNFLYMR